jgi:putative transposase
MKVLSQDYRHHAVRTRAGTINVALPELLETNYYSGRTREPRQRAQHALTQVFCQCYVDNASTRQVDRIVKTTGMEGISKSQVSAAGRELDAFVEAFRSRPLWAGPYSYVWLDAMTQKVREGGLVEDVVVVTATGVNNDGRRELLGYDAITAPGGAGWTAFLRSLAARGLAGVALVISDQHRGLRPTIATLLPSAAWQRCRAHFARDLLRRVPEASQGTVAALVRSIFDQPNRDGVWAQHARVVEQLSGRFDAAAEMLAQAAPDLLAFAAFPTEHWANIRSTNPQGRLTKYLRRMTGVVGIFPDRATVLRLVGTVLSDQNEEWAVAKRYMGSEGLAKGRLRPLGAGRP